MLRRYANFVPGTFLTAGIDDSQTNLPVNSTAGFPVVPFILAIANDGLGGGELVLCTDVPDGTNFTVTRGFDSTSPVAADENDLVEHTSGAIDYREAGIVSIDQAERDALAGEDLWVGRVIYNTDADRVDVNTTSGWAGLFPVGAMIPFTAMTLPDGFLFADGSEILRANYPELDALYAADSYPHGPGNGTTTFNLPDMRQKFPLGLAGAGTGSVLGGTGGAIDHVHTGPSHTHGPGTLTVDSQGAHTHTNSDTASGGSHLHTLTHTHNAPAHTHTNPNTGTSGAHAHFLDGGATASAGGHSHTFSDSFTTSTNSSGSDRQTGIGVVAAFSHSHTGSVSGTTSSVSSHSHGPGTLDTDSAGDHTHAQSSTGSSGGTATTGASVTNTGSDSGHTHTQAATGSSGAHTHTVTAGATAAAGTGNTGTSNPPFLAIPWIVRY